GSQRFFGFRWKFSKRSRPCFQREIGGAMRIQIVLGIGLLTASASAQQSQNPSPMVEHTRAHPRLKEEHPDGRREKLAVGTLFLPATLKREAKVPLVIHCHGAPWLAEVAAARHGKTAVIAIQAGAGSGVYARLFADPKRFGQVLKEAEDKAGMRFDPVTLTA